MATPPTLSSSAQTSWTNTADTVTLSVTVSTNDILVVVGLTEDSANTLGSISGGGLTYTLRQSDTTASHVSAYVWTAPSTSNQTFSISLTRSPSNIKHWGYAAYVFSGSDGVGNSGKAVTTGAPSLALATAGDNSAIVAVNGDWAALSSTRTWRTVNSITPTAGNGLEKVYVNDSGAYTAYSAYWSDAGAAGSTTVGLSAPTGQTYSLLAVEVKGAAGASTVNGTATIAGAGTATATAVQGSTAGPTGAGALATPAVIQAAGASPTGVGALSATVTQAATASSVGAGVLAAAATQAAGVTLAGAGVLSSAAVQGGKTSPAGAGVLTATGGSGAIQGAATLTGAGVLTVAAVQRTTMTGTGAGALAAAAVQGGKASPAGAGVVAANGVLAGSAAIAAAAALSAPATQAATAVLVGAGALSATNADLAVPGSLTPTTAAGRIANATTSGRIATTTSGGDA